MDGKFKIRIYGQEATFLSSVLSIFCLLLIFWLVFQAADSAGWYEVAIIAFVFLLCSELIIIKKNKEKDTTYVSSPFLSWAMLLFVAIYALKYKNVK